MELTFVIPCRNASQNIDNLYASLLSQTDKEWQAIFIDDVSDDDTAIRIRDIADVDQRVETIINTERSFALLNIIEAASTRVKDGIVAVVDGDDQLCNDNTVSLVRAGHSQAGMVVWTAHRWDINGLNISKEMPMNVNPYQYPWCASHLRTFDASLLKQIPVSNFKDHKGRWFERGYDQALMLPLLARASARRYIPDVCYLYNINSVSVDDRDWAEVKQLRTVNFIRARGFVSE